MASLIKRILFATDFSTCAERALGYALTLTDLWKSELTVMTVLELYPGMDPDYTVNKMYLDHLRDEGTRQLASLETRVKAAGRAIATRIDVGIRANVCKPWRRKSMPTCWWSGHMGEPGSITSSWAVRRSGWYASRLAPSSR